MNTTVLVVAVAATYSLTMLIVADKVTVRPREWVQTLISGHGYASEVKPTWPGSSVSLPGPPVGYLCECENSYDTVGALLDHIEDERDELRRQVPQSKTALLMYLVRCPWCASIYVAAPVLWSAWCFGTRAWWFVPAAALAARAVTGTWSKYAAPNT